MKIFVRGDFYRTKNLFEILRHKRTIRLWRKILNKFFAR